MLWWTEDLETGIDIIDEQHKSIFDKAKEIFDLGPESDIETVEKIFIFLMNYANNHFYEEEMLMLENSYKGFLNYRKKHNHFIEEIYRIYQKTIENSSEENLNELKVLIIDWLANHISCDDKEFITTLD